MLETRVRSTNSPSGLTVGSGATPITGGTVGSVLFVGPGPVMAQDNANLFWDDTNNKLGIGTATPNADSQVDITYSVNDTAAHGLRIANTNSGASARGQLRILNDAGEIAQYGIFSSAHPSNPNLTHFEATKGFKITTDSGVATGGTSVFDIFTGGWNAGSKFHIDGTGRVGIGTTSPGDYHANANNLVVYEAGNGGITIAGGTSNLGGLYFADGTSSSSPYAGYLYYNHATDDIRLGTASNDRFLITSTGLVGIGTTLPTEKLSVVGNILLGEHSATPAVRSLLGQSGLGTNIAGAALNLAGGKGTGTGAAGAVNIQTAPVGLTGTALNALVTAAQFDASTTARDTRMFLYDVDNATLERVTVGDADSGGVGYKVLRIPN